MSDTAMKNKSADEEKEDKEENVIAAFSEVKDMDSDEEVVQSTNSSDAQRAFDYMVKVYLEETIQAGITGIELEVRFGTGGIKPFTKSDYDKVIKKLKTRGFQCMDETGEYSLRIENQFLEKNSGKIMQSPVRVEINGLTDIQRYCKTNDIKEVSKNKVFPIGFTNKKRYFSKTQNKPIQPFVNADFQFKVSLQTEEKPVLAVRNNIMEDWSKYKKGFRYLNRVTFTHPDYPVNVDVSIVKYGDKEEGQRHKMKMVRSVGESNVFNNQPVYEFEIEVVNNKIGVNTKFDTWEKIATSVREVIKIVLSGLQGTNYPVSYSEQRGVLGSYMKMIYGSDYNSFDPAKNKIRNNNFIGPSSITLHLENIAPADDNFTITNIRNNYTVTEKADGDRHLLFINERGYIYLIDTNMNVMFTGAITKNDLCFNTLLDGELITRNKIGEYMNLYAAFDIYYLNNEDVRAIPFMMLDVVDASKDKDKKDKDKKYRFVLLKQFIKQLKPTEIRTVRVVKRDVKSTMEEVDKMISPINIVAKEFYPLSRSDTIFSACKMILDKANEGRFVYETDGLIFTPAHLGVGSDKPNVAGPKKKITWDKSFKWKPPNYNTIDFAVTTVKGKNGADVIKTIFKDGMNLEAGEQLEEYKVVQLKCTFIPSQHMYANPCQALLNEMYDLGSTKNEDNYNQKAIPLQFYPTDPYDNDAGVCHIKLTKDRNGTSQMFTHENQVFTDNTIVEFSYDSTRDAGMRWVPLRVRYDKTADMLQGNTNFGNAYHVANDIWKSIHNPVEEDILKTGMNIPSIESSEDKYYNSKSGVFYTDRMKNFHNLFVKKALIKSVAKRGNTLIDYACGKAGDLPKWISAQLSFVFGIDIHKDNLENKLDGACIRFLKSREKNKNMPYALFVNGDSSFNIKNGSAMLDDKATLITKAVFGQGPKDEDKIGKAVVRQYGKGADGFDVSSCQFALHYFLKTPDTLKGFMKNLAECTKLDGYFIGTAYDGELVFKELSNKQNGESIQIVEEGHKVWEIIKRYDSDSFNPDSSSIGYQIDVYQDSINKVFSEYLINFDYLTRVMELYGFKLASSVDLKGSDLPNSSGLFKELFTVMQDVIKQNKMLAKDYGQAQNMTKNEKRISFLNRYFVYKKVRHVNTDKVELDLEQYYQEKKEDGESNEEESKQEESNEEESKQEESKQEEEKEESKQEESKQEKSKQEEKKKEPKKKKQSVRKISTKLVLNEEEEDEKEKEKEEEEVILNVKPKKVVKAKPIPKVVVQEPEPEPEPLVVVTEKEKEKKPRKSTKQPIVFVDNGPIVEFGQSDTDKMLIEDLDTEEDIINKNVGSNFKDLMSSMMKGKRI
jgi:hypothetical protein